MVTLSIDDRIDLAKQVTEIMYQIDPEGRHLAEVDQSKALEIAKRISPDIIWLDIEMPGKDGLAMAAELKKKSPDSNIVFVTGFPDYAMDAFGLHVSGYILKPITEEKIREEINNLKNPIAKKTARELRIQCFGNFEVFYRGKMIRFSRSLSKEAFAYLVDRRGAGCTVGEICAVLWEDRQATMSLKSQCRVILGSLKKDLEDVGAEDAIVKLWNTWSISVDKVSCDYYDFLRKDAGAVNSFRGEYMAQYSWAEMTIGYLYDVTREEAAVKTE